MIWVETTEVPVETDDTVPVMVPTWPDAEMLGWPGPLA
ncbi:uncharacterized protein AruCF_3783 [Achromobacter ruhlandii]|nr:uncharacterized protein AruCF_3783 [Achromobacter ruhlandii]